MSHNDTTPPISLSEQTKVRMPFLMLIGLLGVAATASIAWTNLRGAAVVNAEEISNHEARLTKLEASATEISVMRNDIMWIRRTMEHNNLSSASSFPAVRGTP